MVTERSRWWEANRGKLTAGRKDPGIFPFRHRDHDWTQLLLPPTRGQRRMMDVLQRYLGFNELRARLFTIGVWSRWGVTEKDRATEVGTALQMPLAIATSLLALTQGAITTGIPAGLHRYRLLAWCTKRSRQKEERLYGKGRPWSARHCAFDALLRSWMLHFAVRGAPSPDWRRWRQLAWTRQHRHSSLFAASPRSPRVERTVQGMGR
jgi:hypothetical protein